jgi:hypothetical protein
MNLCGSLDWVERYSWLGEARQGPRATRPSRCTQSAGRSSARQAPRKYQILRRNGARTGHPCLYRRPSPRGCGPVQNRRRKEQRTTGISPDIGRDEWRGVRITPQFTISSYAFHEMADEEIEVRASIFLPALRAELSVECDEPLLTQESTRARAGRPSQRSVVLWHRSADSVSLAL